MSIKLQNILNSFVKKYKSLKGNVQSGFHYRLYHKDGSQNWLPLEDHIIKVEK